MVELASRKSIEDTLITTVFADQADDIQRELFQAYQKDYFNGIEHVFGNTENYTSLNTLKQQFKLNMSKFAAAKTYHQVKELKSLRKKFDKPKQFQEAAKPVNNKYRRWNAVENNTMRARARTAKQYDKFNKESAPNIEWLHTRSATPREAHLKFVGTVLPKDHPFWNQNQPGNLYECKCDWRTTDKTATDKPKDEVKPPPGLNDNPHRKGEAFTDKHPYHTKLKRQGSKEINKFTYKEDNVTIHVAADYSEIAQNLTTAKLSGKFFNKVVIQPELTGQSNPEFKLDGKIADAARINKISGIKNAFRQKINKQNCEIVIIDFDLKFDTSKKLSKKELDEIAGRFLNRKKDFENGVRGFIQYNNYMFEIKLKDLKQHTITKVLKGNLPNTE